MSKFKKTFTISGVSGAVLFPIANDIWPMFSFPLPILVLIGFFVGTGISHTIEKGFGK